MHIVLEMVNIQTDTSEKPHKFPDMDVGEDTFSGVVIEFVTFAIFSPLVIFLDVCEISGILIVSQLMKHFVANTGVCEIFSCLHL